MTGTNSEIESNSASLILPEIQESDLNLAQDLLAIPDDHMNGIKIISNSDIISEHIHDSFLSQGINVITSSQNFLTKDNQSKQMFKIENNLCEFLNIKKIFYRIS